MKKKSNMIFLCSRYRGDTETNLKNARKYARLIAKCGYPVVAPHLLYTQFLNDSDAAERIEGIKLGIESMKLCSQIWIFGTSISDGMKFEIEKAKELDIEAVLFDEDGNTIDTATLKIDDRIDSHYRQIVNGLKFRVLGGYGYV